MTNNPGNDGYQVLICKKKKKKKTTQQPSFVFSNSFFKNERSILQIWPQQSDFIPVDKVGKRVSQDFTVQHKSPAFRNSAKNNKWLKCLLQSYISQICPE